MAYQRPMVTVDQNMTVTPMSIERDQPAFIFGPNYQLYRYDNADEKAKTYIGSYNGEKLQKEYPGAVNPDKVDQAYTKLFGDDVVVEIAELDASVEFPENTAALRALKGGYSQFMFSGKKYVNIDENGSTQMLDDPMTRNLAVGDVLWVEYNYKDKEDSVVVLTGKLLTTVTEVSYKKGYDADDTDLEEEKFTGTLVVVDDAIPESEGNVITVTRISLVNVLDGVEFESRTKNADCKYYWQTGDKTGEKTIKVSTPKTKNLGEATLTVSGGEEPKFYTLVFGTAPSKVNKDSELIVRLSGSDYSATVSGVSDETVTIVFGEGVGAPSKGGSCTVFLATTEDVDTYGVQVNENLEYKYNGEYLKVLSAELYATHRELLSSYADNIHSLSGAANVSAALGTIDPDNPLAMGVYMAALNAATDDGDETPPIYYMAVPSDDNDGYASVLNKASLTDKVYVLAPTTRDESVLDLVQSHVTTMSSKQNKQWRIAVASAEIATEKAVLTRNDNPNAVDYVAVALSKSKGYVTDASEVSDFYAFRIVQSASDTDANDDAGLKTSVVEGDKIRFNFHTNRYSEVEYDTYEVKKVVNNSTVIVKTSDKFITPLASNTPGRIEIYHEYTKSETADVIARTSKQFGTRRMVNVYPSHFKSDGVLLTGEFAACAVAGLISATEPQQPITNVSVRGIDDIELTYSTYSKEDLDTIAAGGTFIVAQDLPEDKVYVRHQITTAYADGNLNTGELSVTKNVDSISYAFAEVFRPYYGKYNITDDLLKIFENLATQLISQFGGSTSVYGPQLIADETKINYVRQNELMKDHVDISITLGVPYPCNNIDIVLTV